MCAAATPVGPGPLLFPEGASFEAIRVPVNAGSLDLTVDQRHLELVSVEMLEEDLPIRPGDIADVDLDADLMQFVA